MSPAAHGAAPGSRRAARSGGSRALPVVLGVLGVLLVGGLIAAFVMIGDTGESSSGGTEAGQSTGGNGGEGTGAGTEPGGSGGSGDPATGDTGGDAPAVGADRGTDTEPNGPTEREPRYKEGDETRTIDTNECVNAREHWDQEGENEGSVTMPDFYDKHFASVKECIQAAGWKYTDDEKVNEVLKGEGMVVNQSPKRHEAFNPETDEITLYISTGYEN
ncbi:PASTA domain-containing protein [Streptomyces calidiresistens]|nr:PASTA domain-containing protein [Streptomyces calidiresistens]